MDGLNESADNLQRDQKGINLPLCITVFQNSDSHKINAHREISAVGAMSEQSQSS